MFGNTASIIALMELDIYVIGFLWKTRWRHLYSTTLMEWQFKFEQSMYEIIIHPPT